MIQSQQLKTDLSPVEQVVPHLAQVDPGKRDELAHQLALLLGASAASCGPAELDAFDTMFIDLVPTISSDTRAFLSQRLATIPNAPHRITFRLAREPIDIARPILVQSVVLTDDDLLLICDEFGASHMTAIAQRTPVSARVTDMLVHRGNDVVRIAVARNPQASITSKGFVRLAGQAREDRDMEQILVSRPDLPGSAVQILVQHGTIISRRAFTVASKPVVPSISRGKEFEAYDFAAARAHVDLLSRQGLYGETLLMRFIAEEKLPEALVVMARLVGVSIDDVQSWYVAEPPDQLLVASKAYGFESRAVFGLLGLGRWRHSFDASSRQKAIQRYQQLTKPQAVKLLGQWRKTRHTAAESLN